MISHQNRPHDTEESLCQEMGAGSSCSRMEGHHLDIEDFIQQNYVNLTKKLDVKSVIPYLMQPEILLRSDKERILAKFTKEDQAGELLDILTHNGKCTVDVFINALEETKQTHLLDLLGSQYRKKGAVEFNDSSSNQGNFSETAANPGQADDECDSVSSDPIATGAPSGSMQPDLQA
ncbi:caspase-2-like [Branchiostoma floridae x Branchiostoma japonicum]